MIMYEIDITISYGKKDWQWFFVFTSLCCELTVAAGWCCFGLWLVSIRLHIRKWRYVASARSEFLHFFFAFQFCYVLCVWCVGWEDPVSDLYENKTFWFVISRQLVYPSSWGPIRKSRVGRWFWGKGEGFRL